MRKLPQNTVRRSPLSKLALDLLALLELEEAYGPRDAIKQRILADELGCTTRDVQLATAEILSVAQADLMLVMGSVPLSRCSPPCGVYLATGPDDLLDYERQLKNRAIENFRRYGCVQRIRRQWEADRARVGRLAPGEQMVLAMENP